MGVLLGERLPKVCKAIQLSLLTDVVEPIILSANGPYKCSVIFFIAEIFPAMSQNGRFFLSLTRIMGKHDCKKAIWAKKQEAGRK